MSVDGDIRGSKIHASEDGFLVPEDGSEEEYAIRQRPFLPCKLCYHVWVVLYVALLRAAERYVSLLGETPCNA